MKIGVISLGCAKNLVDTENLLGLLKASNQEITTSYEEAEAIIINTCGFIESAKTEAIETILNTEDYRQDSLKKLIVMGCLAQRYKQDLEQEMPEVDRFISIDEYDHLGSILSEVLGVKIANDYGKAPRMLSGKPWMAYLRIADGCDNKCSYCAIPNIRGPFRSSPVEQVVAEAKTLAQSGVKELNLIAQDSSRYGYDWDKQLHLSELLKQLDQIEGLHWIRILYLYPDEIPDDLIDTMKQSRHILPYFDIPTQHGSDRILAAMHRRGTHDTIVERAEKIRSEIPDAVLRTTLIAGFPGETLEDHAETLRMIREVHWDHLGAFTYSKEEDTPSYDMEDDVSEEEKQRRRDEIMALQESIVEQDHIAYLNTVQEVLVEGIDPLTKLYLARSAMYAPDGVDGSIRFHSDRDLNPGDFVNVRLEKISGQNFIGTEVQ
ncbi:MAG: 30S ribosomal protein S12 methylthiotransferase RimO [Solobacterium sp.]|jgi:ribosomal protein S12 methylthiotransferase|nr:30S ribosomal protein S12 methylthiotransferase RimO [Solobacterium sp.]MCH4266342.1 30S ribosomal protein S12 methylthiotransferase RimO [Solobacterium sp.]